MSLHLLLCFQRQFVFFFPTDCKTAFLMCERLNQHITQHRCMNSSWKRSSKNKWSVQWKLWLADATSTVKPCLLIINSNWIYSKYSLDRIGITPPCCHYKMFYLCRDKPRIPITHSQKLLRLSGSSQSLLSHLGAELPIWKQKPVPAKDNCSNFTKGSFQRLTVLGVYLNYYMPGNASSWLWLVSVQCVFTYLKKKQITVPRLKT